MTCKHCVARIKSALEQVEGVQSAEVVLEPGSATVVGTASAAALIEAVEDTGKSASVMSAPATATATDDAPTVHLAVDGMTCKHCVARIKSALEQVEGVQSAEVVLEPGSATVVGTASAAAL